MSTMPNLPEGFEWEDEAKEPVLPEGFQWEEPVRKKMHRPNPLVQQKAGLLARALSPQRNIQMPTESFGESVGKLGRFLGEHPGKALGALGVGFGKATTAPLNWMESWLREEGLITPETPPNIARDLLGKASSYLKENLEEEGQRKVEELERGGGVIPLSLVTRALKPILGDFKDLITKGPSLEGAMPGRRPPITLEGEVAGKAPRGLKALFGEPATMESGLTKYRAMEAKRPGMAVITPARQEKLVTGLNKEATDLAKASVEKHLPVAKKIEEGFDFGKQWEEGFGRLKKAAEKYNPEIDITPVSQLLRETRGKYTGIPKLHDEAAKVMREVRAFAQKPQTGMGNLLRIYRSNNQKLKDIYVKARTEGKQEEYVNFLEDMNRAIATSFENTLPADSAWMKQFREMNRNYANFRNTEKALIQLKPILGGEPTPANLAKFASDPKAQKRLELSMGKEGAQEIVQLSKDLISAIDSIKQMTKSDWKKWHALLPLNFLIPGIGKAVGLGAAIYKGTDLARRAYGFWLSQPAKRKALDQAFKAIAENDPKKFEVISDELISPELGKVLFEKYSPKKQISLSDKGAKSLEKTIEVNPEFAKSKTLPGEEPQYIRRQDAGISTGKEKINYKKEWDKYLNPKLLEKYYSTPFLGGPVYFARVGEIFKDPKLLKTLKGTEDIPVYVDYKLPGFGRHLGTMINDKSSSEIMISPSLTPSQLRSTLSHEAIHALQLQRKTPSGSRRLIERTPSTPPKTFEEYLKNLNEVNARKFQRWVDLPINRYRTALEKTRVAKKLWEEQQKKANPPK